MAIEDRRLASTISIDLSKQLMTAASGIIAIAGAFTIFVLDKREPGIPTAFVYLALLLASISFISSIVKGGLGITTLRNSGIVLEEQKGNKTAEKNDDGTGITTQNSTTPSDDNRWNIAVSKQYFNDQAIYCLVGLIFFFIALAIPGRMKAEVNQEKLKSTIAQNEKEIESTKKEIKILRSQVIQLRNDLTQIKASTLKRNASTR